MTGTLTIDQVVLISFYNLCAEHRVFALPSHIHVLLKIISGHCSGDSRRTKRAIADSSTKDFFHYPRQECWIFFSKKKGGFELIF